MATRTNPLVNFFSAKSIALIGASIKTTSPGYTVAQRFQEFEGEVYYVNPKGGELFGKTMYKRVTEIEEPVDFALIITPARFAPSALKDCVSKGIRSVVIASGGFSEIGEEGKLLQEEIEQTIKESNDIRVIGPNCVGIYCPKRKLDTIFITDKKVRRPKHGPISFFSQSGAFGIALLDQIYEIGKGKWISRFISYGNAVDIDEGDILDYFGKDEETKVIVGYMEGFGSGRDFLESAKEISKEKPIILIKANRTAQGASASASHTASVATANDKMTDDLLASKGIIRVLDWKEMLIVARAFATQPLPKGRRVAILTNGGGTAVMASDSIGDNNLELAKLSTKTISGLKERLPSFYIVSNPLDLTGSSTSEQFMLCLNALNDDDNVDAICFIVLPSPPAVDVSELIKSMQIMKKKLKKTILAVSLGGEEAAELQRTFEGMGIPTFNIPEEAIYGIRRLVEYAEYKSSFK